MSCIIYIYIYICIHIYTHTEISAFGFDAVLKRPCLETFRDTWSEAFGGLVGPWSGTCRSLIVSSRLALMFQCHEFWAVWFWANIWWPWTCPCHGGWIEWDPSETWLKLRTSWATPRAQVAPLSPAQHAMQCAAARFQPHGPALQNWRRWFGGPEGKNWRRTEEKICGVSTWLIQPTGVSQFNPPVIRCLCNFFKYVQVLFLAGANNSLLDSRIGVA